MIRKHFGGSTVLYKTQHLDQMEEMIAMIIMLLVMIGLEAAVTYGLRKSLRTVKPWIKNVIWVIHVYGIINLAVFFFWAFFILDSGPPAATWFSALVMGGVFVFFVPKVLYALFLLVEFMVWIGAVVRRKVKRQPTPVNPSRRRFIGQAGLILASVPFASFLYGVTKGKYNYQIHRLTLKFKNLPDAFDGFTISQISDVHSGSFSNKEAVKRGIDMIKEAGSDVFLFTGDLVNSVATEIEPYMGLFGGIAAPFGKFSVLGNHDYGEYEEWNSEDEKDANLAKLKSHHAEMGFRLLNNESVLLKKDGQSIRLAGVENWGKPPFPSKGDLDKTFADNPDGREFTVLMSHDPSHWDFKVLDHKKHVDLTLSGHTHGMQFGVEIPGWKWSPVKYFYPRWAGLYQEGEKALYVNRGFGFIGFPGRVGIMPEITVIELKKG